MKIRAKERIKHHPYYLEAGDVVTVPDEVGQLLVSNGWVENVDTGESAEAAADPVTLDIHGAGHASTSTEV